MPRLDQLVNLIVPLFALAFLALGYLFQRDQPQGRGQPRRMPPGGARPQPPGPGRAMRPQPRGLGDPIDAEPAARWRGSAAMARNAPSPYDEIELEDDEPQVASRPQLGAPIASDLASPRPRPEPPALKRRSNQGRSDAMLRPPGRGRSESTGLADTSGTLLGGNLARIGQSSNTLPRSSLVHESSALGPDASSRANQIRDRFRSSPPETLRELFVLQEIFGSPRALGGSRPRRPGS